MEHHEASGLQLPFLQVLQYLNRYYTGRQEEVTIGEGTCIYNLHSYHG